ncbi:hypothetical protein VTJ04DRAFT_2542 [Mycothermus thermophilus]|uniref:uncharacterized protein n=1 Tax=Humicola insolens TaxID=85995 RepID=UPI0037449B70
MTTTKLALLGLAAVVAHARWWDGAPDCAQPCFSSHWSPTSDWPAPTTYCAAAGDSAGAAVSDCLNTACSETPSAVASYASLSSSLCARWSACSAEGLTGTYTITAPAFTGTAFPGYSRTRTRTRTYTDIGSSGGRWDPDDDDHDDLWDWDWDDDWWSDHWRTGDKGDHHGWRPWTRTWTGGVYTVTGCEWNGNVWADGGPGGCPPDGRRGCSPWGPWGRNWTFHTTSTTLTQYITNTYTLTSTATATAVTQTRAIITDDTDNSDDHDDEVVTIYNPTAVITTTVSTSVGPAVVVLAVSGEVTSTSVVDENDDVKTTDPAATGAAGGGSGETGDGVVESTFTAAAPGGGGKGGEWLGVKVVGAVLGGLGVVVGLVL